MDYRRIYDAFIADRRNSKLEGYTETHHVVPRCVGGADDVENLIALTPEDHYFAHLLLARIHGGKLWHAVAAMGRLPAGERNLRTIKNRVGYGIARRKCAELYSENFSGSNNPSFDSTEYVFRHRDGREVRGVRSELTRGTGLKQKAVSCLITGGLKSCYGWFAAHKFNSWADVVRSQEEGRRDPTVFNLVRADGSTWSGTHSQFREQFGRGLYFQSAIGHCAGWFRDESHIPAWEESEKTKRENAATARGDIRGASNPNADTSPRRFRKGDDEVTVTRAEFAARFGFHHLKVTQLLLGDLKSLEGWTCEPDVKRVPASATIRFFRDDGETREGLLRDFLREFKLPRSSIVRCISRGKKYQNWKFEVING